jgi:hypothetical protein
MKQNFTGLGDVVAAATKAVGIKQRQGCGCARRQKWLNEKFPFKKRGGIHVSNLTDNRPGGRRSSGR